MTNPAIREALKVSTNAEAWIDAGGGEKAYAPAESIVNPAVVGYQAEPGVLRPATRVTPRLPRRSSRRPASRCRTSSPSPTRASETTDKLAAALKETWDQAGFDVTLDGLGDTYYDVIQKPTKDSDVIWGGWGADWPSAITVTPPLFDSRPNLTANSDGQDYGAYESDEFNAPGRRGPERRRRSTTRPPPCRRPTCVLGEDVAYIPLEIAQFYLLYGSKVTNFTTTPASSGYPDLGAIGVES